MISKMVFSKIIVAIVFSQHLGPKHNILGYSIRQSFSRQKWILITKEIQKGPQRWTTRWSFWAKTLLL
jgi:hypothetical protein